MTDTEMSRFTRPRKLGERETIRSLLPYLWPRNEMELRVRVVAAIVCLFIAKIANVYVPVLYKHAIDALGTTAGTVAVLPVGMILAYGLARVLSLAFGELRDAIFAKVAQRSIRAVALNVFRHLHALSLRFHLERQTGGLSRAVERGTKAIQTLLSFMLFNILPTLLEILLVCAILWGMFNIWFALATFTTVVLYIAFTLVITEWRTKFRREMNEMDNQANTKAIDSLLNYETVKYFGNEEHEARRYDNALQLLRKGGGAEPDQPVAAQYRPGRDHLHRPDGRDVHGGARHHGGHHDHRRLRAGQHLPAPALPAAQLPRLRLSRDQAGSCRHGEDVRAAGDRPRDRRRSRCQGAGGGRRHGGLRGMSSSATIRAGRS